MRSTDIPPHQRLAYLLLLTGGGAAQILNDCRRNALTAFLVDLRAVWRKDRKSCNALMFQWLATLNVDLSLKGRDFEKMPKTLSDFVIGRTTFDDYLSAQTTEKEVYGWVRKVEETLVIPLAQADNTDAFDLLVLFHQRCLKAFIDVRLPKNCSDSEELLQLIWLKAFSKIATFNSELGSFFNWIRLWARLVLVEYYHQKKNRRQRELNMSELLEEMDRGGMDITQNELLDLLGPCGEESSEPDPRVVADSRKILHSLFDGKNRVECLLSFMFVRIFGMKPRWLVGQLSKKSLAELSKEAKLLLMAELDGAKDFIEDCFRTLEEQLKRPASELPEIADAIIRRKGHGSNWVIGDATFEDYFGIENPDPLKLERLSCAKITNWWENVQRRLLKSWIWSQDGVKRNWTKPAIEKAKRAPKDESSSDSGTCSCGKAA